MINRKTVNTESAEAVRLAQRKLALEARKADILSRSDLGPVARAQLLAELEGMWADWVVEYDELIMVERLAEAQATADQAQKWAQDSVANSENYQ